MKFGPESPSRNPNSEEKCTGCAVSQRISLHRTYHACRKARWRFTRIPRTCAATSPSGFPIWSHRTLRRISLSIELDMHLSGSQRSGFTTLPDHCTARSEHQSSNGVEKPTILTSPKKETASACHARQSPTFEDPLHFDSSKLPATLHFDQQQRAFKRSFTVLQVHGIDGRQGYPRLEGQIEDCHLPKQCRDSATSLPSSTVWQARSKTAAPSGILNNLLLCPHVCGQVPALSLCCLGGADSSRFHRYISSFDTGHGPVKK